MVKLVSRRDAMRGITGCSIFSGVGSVFANTDEKFRRGVSLWPWFALTREYPPPSRDFPWPPFQSNRVQPTATDLANLRANHFDFVRIPIDPGPFVAMRGPRRNALFGQLEKALEMVNRAELGVILNPQSNESTHYWTPRQFLDQGVKGSFPIYRDFIVELASLTSRVSGRALALELFNEPPNRCGSSEWASQQMSLLRDVRGVAPSLKLILTGACGGMVDGLEALAPIRGDPNVIYNFHYYEPYVFSHQGAGWMEGEPMYRYLRNVPWPASSGDESVARDASIARINSDTSLVKKERDAIIAAIEQSLSDYFACDVGSAHIQRDFERVEVWGKKHGVWNHQVILGEFGATKLSEAADRARYLRDIRVVAEAYGFGWAVWNLFDVMGLTLDDDGRKLDEALLLALGMTVKR